MTKITVKNNEVYFHSLKPLTIFYCGNAPYLKILGGKAIYLGEGITQAGASCSFEAKTLVIPVEAEIIIQGMK